MGAAVAKAALEEFTDRPRPQAELRLAVAEQFMLRWRPSAGGGTGIWDAEAICVNRGLLSALDDIVLLKEIHAFPMASPARRHMDKVLGVAMSRLMEEFLFLRVWDSSELPGLTGHRFARDRQLSASVSLAFPRDLSASTEFSLSTSSDFYASVGSHSSRSDLVAIFVDGTFLEDVDLICRQSLAVLHEVALRVIRAGYTEELLRAFNKAPCDVLDRFLSILQVERRSLEEDGINFEDAEWWTTEDMVKRWIIATRLVVKALVVMERQLQAQICGAFESFRHDYFLAMAKQSIVVLLKFVDGFTSVKSPEKLIYVLEMYEALSNAAPDILLLFTGGVEHAELVATQVADVLAKLARTLRIATGGLITKIRTECSHGESNADVGVHPLTRFVMTCVELLASHRTALDFILAGGDEGEPGASAGGAERVTTFGGLVAELIEALERNLEEKSMLTCNEAGGSASVHMFLANNISFVLNRAADADVATFLGDEWIARHRSQLERHAASYVEATWGPVVACLEKGKPAKSLVKFNAAFTKAHGTQVWCEVPDPLLRAALRKALSDMVVSAYSAFVRKNPKLENAVRYTAQDLAEWLSEVFEGGPAYGRTSS